MTWLWIGLIVVLAIVAVACVYWWLRREARKSDRRAHARHELRRYLDEQHAAATPQHAIPDEEDPFVSDLGTVKLRGSQPLRLPKGVPPLPKGNPDLLRGGESAPPPRSPSEPALSMITERNYDGDWFEPRD